MPSPDEQKKAQEELAKDPGWNIFADFISGGKTKIHRTSSALFVVITALGKAVLGV